MNWLFIQNGIVTWLVIAAILFVIEGVTVQLVCVWFGIGAMAASLSAALHLPPWVQLLVFFLSSIAVLIVGRPPALRHLRVRKQPTNADRVIGQVGTVRQAIDNVAETGRVYANGLDWTARSLYGQPIPEGARVLVRQIDGVKLIVEPVMETPPPPPA